MPDYRARFPSSRLDEMGTSDFPQFVSGADRARMAELVPQELQAWREGKAKFHAIQSTNQRLRERPKLEALFEDLKSAWDRVKGEKMYRVKSKSSGSYFGKYATMKAAEIDAEEANEEKKYEKADWEAEEAPEVKELDEEEPTEEEVTMALKTIRRALRRNR